MAKKKQYVFCFEDRQCLNGRSYPDYKSGTFKSKRKAEEAMHKFDALPGCTSGGSATMWVRRVR